MKRLVALFVLFLEAFVVHSFFVAPQWNHCRTNSCGSTLEMSNAAFTRSAEEVYSSLSENSDSLAMEDIKQGWGELKELIEDGDLEPSELEEFYEESSQGGKLDKKGFFTLYQLIDNLFEDDEEDGSEDVQTQEEQTPAFKEGLLSYLTQVHSYDEIKLPCGFDCTDKEREVIQEFITNLETTPNLVVVNNGKVDESQVMGEWNLLYTSSRTMTINKSFSGLGQSSSSMAQIEGIRKRLAGTKYLGKVEYIESFVGEEASFDVRVTGEWMLEGRKNIVTGMPSTSLRVDPEKIIYGPTTNQADDWASLGPIKLLDILYLDGDLMILRGNSNMDSLFVYQRIDE